MTTIATTQPNGNHMRTIPETLLDELAELERQGFRITNSAYTQTHNAPENDSTEFLQSVFGDDLPGKLVLFTLPGERSYWLDPADTKKIRRVLQSISPARNVYVCMSMQDQDAATERWREENPHAPGVPTTRGYADTALSIGGVWTDIDVHSPVHAGDNLPVNKTEALDFLTTFPLSPSLVWDTGYGLQGLWLFREPWVFADAQEREEAKLFMRRFTDALNERAQHRGWHIDGQVKDIARVLRLPGTYNRKVTNDPLFVHVVHVDDEARYNQSDFLPYCSTSTEHRNGTAAPFTVPTNEEQERTLAELREALPYIPADDHETWLKVGMGLHSVESGDTGFDLWVEWSKSCPSKFDLNDCHKRWRSFHDDGGISQKTIFALAIKYSWRTKTYEKEDEAEAEDDAPDTAGRTNGSFPCSDLGNSERMFHLYNKQLLWCDLWKKFLTWDKKRWKIDDQQRVRRWAKKTVRSIYKEAAREISDDDRKRLARWAMASEAGNRLREMVSLIQPEVPIIPTALDTDPWLLTCTNGTIDLRTGALLPHNPTHRITKLAPYAFDSEATAPTWESFLEHIFKGNQELIAWLWRVVGYCLTGHTYEQCFFLCHGIGSNGKSTFLEILRAVLGDYAEQAPFSTFLRKDRDTIPNDLAKLHSCRFVAALESDQGRRLAEAQIKALTGNDPVTARFLHGEFFTYTPQYKIWLATNYRPEIQDSSHAMWRRVRLIPFDVVIPDAEQDKTLPAKLKEELPGIFAWAIRGCLAWQAGGLTPPDIVQAATNAYREEQDTFSEFLTACCLIKPELQSPAGNLYTAYLAWTKESGAEELTQKMFGGKLREHGFRREKSTLTGKIVWYGVGLRPNGPES